MSINAADTLLFPSNTQQPLHSWARTPESSLRGHSLENKPDIRIIFSLTLAVLIRIVQPTSKFRKFIRIIGNQLGKKSEKNQKKQIVFKSSLEMNQSWLESSSTSALSSSMEKVTLHCLCKGPPDIIRIVGTTLSRLPAISGLWGKTFGPKFAILIRIYP